MAIRTSGAGELTWANKGRPLLPSGQTGYRWGDHPALPLQRPIGIRDWFGDGVDGTLITGEAGTVLPSLPSHLDDLALPSRARLVYLDPPFNTGRSFDHYEDALPLNVWLSLIQTRLEALKPLLDERSSIWLHIDDANAHYARCVMDEVFGTDAFVSTVIWQKRRTRESRTSISSSHDQIHVYAPAGPTAWKSHRNRLPRPSEEVRNRDGDPRGPWVDAPFTAPGIRENQLYDIVTPAGTVLHPPEGRSWYATEPVFEELLADNRIWFPRDGAGCPRIKRFVSELDGLVPTSIWLSDEVGSNDDAKRHLQSMGEGGWFDTPKPEQLLARIINIATHPGELVIDPFVGSGTTAAVAHKLRRPWAAIERLPDIVQDVTIPRLSRVVAGRDDGGVTEAVSWTGGGGFISAELEGVAVASEVA